MGSPPTPETGFTGVVLAGGGSARFGRDKLREPVAGVPMLHRAIEAVAPLCEEVLVSVAHVGAPPPTPEDVPVVLVRDVLPDLGPLAGLSSALSQVATPFALVVAGDMPFLEPGVLRLLMERLRSGSVAQVVALGDGDAVRPLPCALRAGLGGRLAELVEGGERRLRALTWEFVTRAVDPKDWRGLDPSGGSLRDVDRPEDL